VQPMRYHVCMFACAARAARGCAAARPYAHGPLHPPGSPEISRRPQPHAVHPHARGTVQHCTVGVRRRHARRLGRQRDVHAALAARIHAHGPRRAHGPQLRVHRRGSLRLAARCCARACAPYEGLVRITTRSRQCQSGRTSAVFGPFFAQTCARSAWFWPYEPMGTNFGMPY
jgi:hypothetical protein